MVRRHGWQLPAHTFQVVAITVFFLLAVSFYVFLAPFLWFHALELVALALYSPLAFAVFILYVRSSAIDPADPGVFAQTRIKHAAKQMLSEVSAGMPIHTEPMQPLSSGLSTPSRTSLFVPSDNLQRKGTSYDNSRVGWPNKSQMFFTAFFGSLCWWVFKDDSCKNDLKLQQPLAEEDVLFCTLCNAEVRKFSKHCRSCDKCVDGFDHHCRWLNNCVGKKNYNTFVSLMASSLALLVLECGIGMAVLVRCFVDKRGLEHQITDKLGNSFSRAPFATVVAVCSLVSLLASIPLGELFCFHLILIRKGITTYEYVVAMRAQNEPQGFSVEGDAQSIPTSPSSSTATALSGSSSQSRQYSRGAWCTPPRVFVDYEDDITMQLGHGRLPSTTDPDLGALTFRRESHSKKSTVRISAWKLSRLKAADATRAAVKAREKSTTLRQLGQRDFGDGERQNTSSSNISSENSVSLDYLISEKKVMDEGSVGSTKGRPGPFFARDDSSFDYRPAGVQAQINSSYSSPGQILTENSGLVPLPAERRCGFAVPASVRHPSAWTNRDSDRVTPPLVEGPLTIPQEARRDGTLLASSFGGFSKAWSGTAASSDGYEASSGESADFGVYALGQKPRYGDFPDSVSEEGRRVDFLLDRSLEGPGPNTTHDKQSVKGCSSALEYSSNSRCTWPERSPSHSSAYNDQSPPVRSRPQVNGSYHGVSRTMPSTLLTLDNLVCSGTSIFYGGPIGDLPVMGRSPPEFSSRDPTNIKVKPSDLVANKLPPRTSRSQSPVFAPTAMLSFSFMHPANS